MYALKIGKELCRVSGRILGNGWLEWWDWYGRGDQGVQRPGMFCEWSNRFACFPDCQDAAD